MVPEYQGCFQSARYWGLFPKTGLLIYLEIFTRKTIKSRTYQMYKDFFLG